MILISSIILAGGLIICGAFIGIGLEHIADSLNNISTNINIWANKKGVKNATK